MLGLLLLLLVAVASSAFAQTADEAWQAFKKASKPPTPPTIWQTQRPTDAQIKEWEANNSVLSAKAAELAREFYTKFPKDARVSEAREQELKLTEVSVQLGNTNKLARLQELRKELAKAPGISENERLKLRIQQVQGDAMRLRNQGVEAVVKALEAGARELIKEFPNRQEPYNLLVQVATAAIQDGDIEKGRKLAKELENAKVPKAAMSLIKTQLKRYDMVGQPFVFIGLGTDGKPIELEKMRGKVVLIDFWASWCGPCMAELPNMKEAYAKYHDKGFEIIGVNLDQDMSALKEAVEKYKIPWRQHFDAGNPDGGWAAKYGISAIPAIWLIDKKGILKDLNGRENLAEKVEKLLAEP